MTPKEKSIVKALVAVAWADGEMQEPEGGVIEGLLSGFDASADEEREVLAWAKTPRSLGDVDVRDLDRDDRELLLSNAALLVQSDGQESDAERRLLAKLAGMLGIGDDQARAIVASARSGATAAHRS